MKKEEKKQIKKPEKSAPKKVLKIKSNYKFQFDQKQLAKVENLLDSIISVEKNQEAKRIFQNILGLLKGKYPNQASFKKATIGLITLLRKLSSTLNEGVEDIKAQRKKRLLKDVITRSIATLAVAVSFASCDQVINPLRTVLDPNAPTSCTYEVWGGALSEKSNLEIYTIKLNDEALNQLENVLERYKNGDVGALGDLNIFIDAEKTMGSAGTAYYNPVKKHPIYLHKDLPEDRYFNTIAHELTHREQYKDGKVYVGGSSSSTDSYNINPTETNAYFNGMLADLKKNNKIHTPLLVKNMVAVMLVYDPGNGSYGKITKEDMMLVQNGIREKYKENLKENNPYEIYKALKGNKEAIRAYFVDDKLPF